MHQKINGDNIIITKREEIKTIQNERHIESRKEHNKMENNLSFNIIIEENKKL